jgi:hypothetical protein
LLETFEKGLTIYNQQVRALNLVWAMIEEVPKEGLRRVAVIGGGFAGLTFGSVILAVGFGGATRQLLFHSLPDWHITNNVFKQKQ